ncbi:MAG: hypothetical protein ACPGRX_04670 [Bdellovibrionales bacterium]
MSEVNANDHRLIDSLDDVIETYQGAGDNAMTGIEIELAFFDPATPDLTPMSIPQNKVVKNATNASCGGDFARNEPTSDMLEIGSAPDSPDNLKQIIINTNKRMACLTKKAADIGLKRSYFQDLPNQTAAQLLQNVVDVERYQAFFAPPRADMTDIAAYFSVCKSNQVSVSYKNTGHILDNIRRLYYLAPFLFMITDNGSGFDEGKPFTGHAGMRHRAALKSRGGVPDYLFTAQNGESYIRAHIDAVMNNPLFVYYDENGKLVRLPSGQWESFNSLRDKGLNTATNYYFAESILWPDVKIAALKDANDAVIGHRFEARMIGVGVHQHASALLIVAGLAFNPLFAEQTDFLLRAYGFDPQSPHQTHEYLQTAYADARNHGGAFLDIPYGNGSMKDFANAFADLLEQAYLTSDLEDDLTPVLTICRSGCTDAKVNRKMFQSLDKALEFQRDFDPDIFNISQSCARMLFEKEIEKTCAQRINAA